MACGHYLKTAISAWALALLTSACGGGGGGGPAPIPPPPPPPSSAFDTAEYRASNSATTARALPAYDLGATGAGVKVAVIDTGINPDLPEFTGRIDPASQDLVAGRGLVDTQGHGTMVSGVIAANRDNIYMHGVAPQATIVSLNVGDPAGCRPGTSDCFFDSAIDDAIDLARTSGARIINMSFGDEEGMTADVWPAIQRAVDAGLIIVMSAGNDGTGNPNGFALQNITDNGGSGLFIIAGAMNANGTIASFSDRAGSTGAAGHYLTALGVGNATVNQFGARVNVNGTSFSAPTIAGAAALLAGAFPNLTGPQIVNLLLTSADDAGAAGTDAVFGRGILNIGRAFQPQGAMQLAGKSSALSLTDNGLSSGPMGDSLSRGGAKAIFLDGYQRAYAFELGGTVKRAGLEQPLHQGLAATGYENVAGSAGPVSFNLTVKRDPTGALRARLDPMRLGDADAGQARAVAGMAVSRLSPRTSMALGFSRTGRALQQRLSGQYGKAFLVAEEPLARAGFHADPATSIAVRHDFGLVALTISSENGRQWQQAPDPWQARPGYRSQSLTLDGRRGKLGYSLGATALDESRTVLGSRFSSLFLSGGSRTWFLDATARLDLGRGWEASSSYRRGWTDVRGTSEIVTRAGLTSETFAADLSKSGLLAAGDQIAFRLSQPLRVVGGGFVLNVPIEYSYATTTAVYGERFMSLAPKGRELDLEMAYRIGLFGGSLDLNAFLRADPGHIDRTKRDAGAAVRFKLGL